MSSPLAIAAVTATLKDLLNDGLLNHDLSSIGSFSVSALPPDRITTGQNEPNQLNLFLYHLTPNLGWRNEGLPARDANGGRLANAPLALDLHYLLTAYGSEDLNAEVLLGYAMQMLHETPILTRAQLRTVLGPPSPVDGTILPGPFGTLSAIDLADQIELIKISPVFLNTEELSKMWTAMQSRYRPTMAYTVSVILIQANGAAKAAPPVLKRGKDDTGAAMLAAPFPSLTRVRPAASDLLPAIRLGDDLLLTGAHLDTQDAVTVQFDNERATLSRQITPALPLSPGALKVHVPAIADDANAMNQWAVGMYAITLRIAQPDMPAWSTNSVPIALAPLIKVSPLSAAAGDIELTITCTPRLLPQQEAQARLIFGARLIAPKLITTPGDATKPTTLTFALSAVAAGEYLVRLRVDGIDSLPVVLTGAPAKLNFDAQQKVSVA
jgi:hypothetical protein